MQRPDDSAVNATLWGAWYGDGNHARTGHLTRITETRRGRAVAGGRAQGKASLQPLSEEGGEGGEGGEAGCSRRSRRPLGEHSRYASLFVACTDEVEVKSELISTVSPK